MASLVLEDVSVEFPLLHTSSRSMRRFALEGALGRKVRLDERHPTIRALSDIDLSVADGDRLALVGPNGAGKTTLLRVAAGLYPPARGRVTRIGKLKPLIGMGTGANLSATGLENIYLLGMHLDIAPERMRRVVDEIVEWTELGPFIGAPLQSYSSGMIMRLAFAVSTAFAPDILLIDEWLGLADAEFQQKAYARMSKFMSDARIVVLASHYRELLDIWCNRAILLNEGRIIDAGPVADITSRTSSAAPQ